MSDIQGIEGIQQVLSEMRALQRRMGEISSSGQVGQAGEVDKPDFGAMLRSSIDEVNEVQKKSSELQEAFTKGDPDVDLADVMIAMQKSSVSFAAMTQVRNKLLSAYQEIMSMQV